MREFKIFGITVCLFHSGQIRIHARSKEQSDKIFKYMIEEGLLQ